MKTLLITLFAIGSIFQLHAQTAEAECLQKTVLFDSLVRAGNYNDAVTPWTHVRKNCPSSSNKIYEAGEAILQYQIEMAAADKKEVAVRELLQLYDDQNKYFPGSASGNTLKKAMALNALNAGNSAEIFALLDKSFSADLAAFTDPNALYTYFELYYNKYKEGDKEIKIEDLFAKQDAIEAQLASSKLAGKNQQRSARMVSKGIDGLLAGVATCETLAPYYESAFEAKKTDTLWLERASRRMMTKRCVASPTFLKISNALHLLKPSNKSAYNLGSAALRSGDRELAATYFIQSAALAENPREKATTYYMLATTVYGTSNKAKAKEYADLAIGSNPSMGKAYMYLAQLYANSGSECGQTPFEQKAIFWLAADMAKKAGDADANLKKSGSDKTMESYLQKAPSAAEIKQAKLGGKSVAFKCWINESVPVPKK